MPQAYRTVFEVSYLSNGTLLWNLIFVAVGVVMAITGLRLWRLRVRSPAVFLTLLSVVWLATSVWFVDTTLCEGRAFRAALREGRCEVDEGVVDVLYEQPAGGHSPGDRIRINGRQFEYSYFTSTLAYCRTVAHGGVLMQGAKVRIHSWNGAILKVEVAQRSDRRAEEPVAASNLAAGYDCQRSRADTVSARSPNGFTSACR